MIKNSEFLIYGLKTLINLSIFVWWWFKINETNSNRKEQFHQLKPSMFCSLSISLHVFPVKHMHLVCSLLHTSAGHIMNRPGPTTTMAVCHTVNLQLRSRTSDKFSSLVASNLFDMLETFKGILTTFPWE